MDIKSFLNNVNNVVVNPLIFLMFAIALLVFSWGAFQYVWNAADDKTHEAGRSSMLWGIVGLVIMVSVFGIIRFVLSTFGITGAASGVGIQGL